MANKEDFDEDDGDWKTIGGRRVFIRNGQSLKDAMEKSGKFKDLQKSNKEKTTEKIVKKSNDEAEGKRIRKSLEEIKSDKYADGTYDLENHKEVNFNSGYQATFQQTGDKYSDEEFGKLVQEYKDRTDGKAYAGKFGGEPEISFHFENEKDAMEICKKYNQVSYWNWKTMEEVKNKDYKKGRGNDYD